MDLIAPGDITISVFKGCFNFGEGGGGCISTATPNDSVSRHDGALNG